MKHFRCRNCTAGLDVTYDFFPETDRLTGRLTISTRKRLVKKRGACGRMVQLLALLLLAIYGIRSERLLIEQLDYNLLFRWFIGLNPDDPVWHPTTLTKNRDRVLNEEPMA